MSRVCKIHDAWRRILQRCYSEIYLRRNPSYRGCSVAPEWHVFSAFKRWMEQQDYVGKQLDKDLLVQGNKTYSKETCCFLSSEVNNFLCTNRKKDTCLPIGVVAREGKFAGHCRNPFTNTQEYLGLFPTADQAHNAWKNRKHELALEYSKLETNVKIINALQTRFLPTNQTLTDCESHNLINKKEVQLAWDDTKRAAVIAEYTHIMSTEYDNDADRSAASLEVVKELAEKHGEAPNGVRTILMKAGVYIKKDATAAAVAATKTNATGGTKRISKEEAIQTLTNQIGAIDPELIDAEILSKLTGKAAAYISSILMKVGS